MQFNLMIYIYCADNSINYKDDNENSCTALIAAKVVFDILCDIIYQIDFTIIKIQCLLISLAMFMTWLLKYKKSESKTY